MSDILYVVMPAYNEEENIEKSVRDWLAVLEGKDERSRIVVADSGSEDGTHNILVKMQKEIPQLMILGDTLKQHGPKLIALYNFAIEQGADYVFQTDSDGQTNPLESGRLGKPFSMEEIFFRAGRFPSCMTGKASVCPSVVSYPISAVPWKCPEPETGEKTMRDICGFFFFCTAGRKLPCGPWTVFR